MFRDNNQRRVQFIMDSMIETFEKREDVQSDQTLFSKMSKKALDMAIYASENLLSELGGISNYDKLFSNLMDVYYSQSPSSEILDLDLNTFGDQMRTMAMVIDTTTKGQATDSNELDEIPNDQNESISGKATDNTSEQRKRETQNQFQALLKAFREKQSLFNNISTTKDPDFTDKLATYAHYIMEENMATPEEVSIVLKKIAQKSSYFPTWSEFYQALKASGSKHSYKEKDEQILKEAEEKGPCHYCEEGFIPLLDPNPYTNARGVSITATAASRFRCSFCMRGEQDYPGIPKVDLIKHGNFIVFKDLEKRTLRDFHVSIQNDPTGKRNGKNDLKGRGKGHKIDALKHLGDYF